MNITEAKELNVGSRVVVTKDDVKFIAMVTAKDDDNLVFMEALENKDEFNYRRTGIVKLK